VKAAVEAKQLGPHGRLHGVWIMARSGSDTALEDLFAIARSDTDPRVRAQAIRAIGDLTDPVLTEKRIEADRGDAKVGVRIAGLARQDTDPRVVLESLIVLRRLRWQHTPEWMVKNVAPDDPALNHAAVQALRHADNWPAVAGLLDVQPQFRRLALRAMAEQRVEFLADELIRRIEDADDPQHRREYADVLSRMVRKLKPWEYWGFRPAPRPAATVDWQQTPAILQVLNARLADRDFAVRAFVLECMLREGAVPELPKLAEWLRAESDAARVAGILEALDGQAAKEVQSLLIESVLRKSLPVAGRTKALAALVTRVPQGVGPQLVELAGQLEDGPVLAAVLREFGARPKLDVDALLLKELDSAQAVVRAEAIRSLGRRGEAQARDRVAQLLLDENRDVRLAATESAGLLKAKDGAESLLSLAAGDDREIVQASLTALRRLRDARAVEVATRALEHSDTQLAAVAYLKEFGQPAQIADLTQAAATNLSFEFQREVARTLTAWEQKYPTARSEIFDALAATHGQGGQPFAWQVRGPLTDNAAAELLKHLTTDDGVLPETDGTRARTVIAEAAGAEIRLPSSKKASNANVWVATAPVRVEAETGIEFLASATGGLTVWLNGDRVHHREKPGAYRLDSDRFLARLRSGTNLIALKTRSTDAAPRFHLRFRRRSSRAEHEQLTQLALQSRGNVRRGREVFENVQKAACINCHRLGGKGGPVGPDLSGIGRRFSRIHLIESILEPSRTVAPSYATMIVVLKSGRTVVGVRVSENDDVLVIGDNKGKTHEIRQADIRAAVPKKESTMPEGLEKKLTQREFVDLLSFLESQKTGK
jgi:putative heme-binding domain-containing protein